MYGSAKGTGGARCSRSHCSGTATSHRAMRCFGGPSEEDRRADSSSYIEAFAHGKHRTSCRRDRYAHWASPGRGHLSHRGRRRVGGWPRGVLEPLEADRDRPHRDGARPDPAPRPDAYEPLARGLAQDDEDAGRASRGRHARGARPRLRDPAEHLSRHLRRPLDAGAAGRGLEGLVPAGRPFLSRARRRRGAAARSASCSRGRRPTAPKASGPSRRRAASRSPRSRRRPSSAGCRAAPSTRASSTIACRSRSSRRSS